MTTTFRNFLLSLTAVAILIGMGCTATKQVSSDEEITTRPDTAGIETEDVSALQAMLTNNRSKLSDLHISQTHDMPKAFLKNASSDESINADPYDGFRIQIISTRDVSLADSVANEFRMWADTTIAGYSAESYVFFQQPFYKVHIGDFHERDVANRFSKLVKNKYPDAWVVHDRIDPEQVPADTASFSKVTPSDSAKKKVGTKSIQEKN